MDLGEMWCEGVDWMQLTQDREQLTGSSEYVYEPSGSIKVGQFLD
jgi:hypothetical protein